MLGLDSEEHQTEGDGGGRQKQQGKGGPLESVADTVTKAFGGKGK